ncbi:MAG: hypothetical protein H7844_14000, partial [Nitrospirae bacterium YQR-1]
MKESLLGGLYIIISSILNINAKSITPLKTKMQITDEREADFVLLIEEYDGTRYILHLEFQSTNDYDIIFRMLRYRLYITQIEKLPVIQYLIYVGNEPLRMSNTLSEPGMSYSFNIIDFKNIDCEKFINSKTPEEIVLSILCDFKSKDVKICLRAMLQGIKDTVVEETKRLKYVRQLEVLSQLRNLQEQLDKEVSEMALVYDIERDM